MKKTWSQKLAKMQGLPKKVKIKKSMERIYGKGRMVVPLPRDVDALMKKARKGKVITISSIQKALAKKYKTDTACPLTTGIFAWIVANAAEEKRGGGQKKLAPYWRTIKNDGSLNPKYPGGVLSQAYMLRKEGHIVSRKGTRLVVKHFEDKLQKL